MKTGRITQLTDGGKSELERAIERLRNPAPGVTLASHGFVKRCAVCEHQTHAKWHEVARGDINPVALIQFVQALDDGGTGVVSCVVDWVRLMTGIDDAAIRAMLEAERTGGGGSSQGSGSQP